MSLRGYKKKTKPALWTMAFPTQVQQPRAKDPKPPAPRKRIAPRSKRRQKSDRGYADAARAFVREEQRKGKRCPVVAAIPELCNGRRYGHPISDKLSENHHVFGRGWNGELVMWRDGWMAVSKQGHRWIHSNKDEARLRGWYAPKGQWNQPAPGVTVGTLRATAEGAGGDA